MLSSSEFSYFLIIILTLYGLIFVVVVVVVEVNGPFLRLRTANPKFEFVCCSNKRIFDF